MFEHNNTRRFPAGRQAESERRQIEREEVWRRLSSHPLTSNLDQLEAVDSLVKPICQGPFRPTWFFCLECDPPHVIGAAFCRPGDGRIELLFDAEARGRA